jgi:amidase
MDELFRFRAIELVGGIRKRQFSCVDVVSASLARIAALDDRYQAFLTVAAEDALQRAERADRVIARGEAVGPLHGLPMALKDLIDTEGIRTTYGSALFRDHVPDADDIVAARLKAAGAIIVGKTNTPEFGYGAITDNELRGPTCNPYDPLRTSGGSSGGSAPPSLSAWCQWRTARTSPAPCASRRASARWSACGRRSVGSRPYPSRRSGRI